MSGPGAGKSQCLAKLRSVNHANREVAGLGTFHLALICKLPRVRHCAKFSLHIVLANVEEVNSWPIILSKLTLTPRTKPS